MTPQPARASKFHIVSDFDRRMKANPGDLEERLRFGQFVISNLVYDRFADAEAALRAYHAARPDQAGDRKLFGYALWVNGKTDEAIEQFRKHLASHPTDSDVFRFLGFACFASGKFLDGLMAFSAGGRLNPQDSAFKAGALGCEMLMEGKDLVSFDSGGEKVYFHITGRAVDPDISHLCGQFCESEFLDLARRHAPRGGGAIDIGSQIGNHSVYFLKFLKPARLWTFDANPVCCRETIRNLSANSQDSSADIRVNNIGLGESPGELYLPDHDELNKGLVAQTDRGTAVKIVRLDSAVHWPVDFIKIDIEGMELEALRGASAIIRKSRPFLMIEIELKNQKESDALFEEFGYEVAAELDRGDQKHRIYRSKERSGDAKRNPAWDALEKAEDAFLSQNFSESRTLLETLVADWPKWDQPVFLLARSLIEIFNTTQDQASIDEAVRLLIGLVDTYADHDEGLRLLARILAALERKDEARCRYAALLALDPEDAEANAFLG